MRRITKSLLFPSLPHDVPPLTPRTRDSPGKRIATACKGKRKRARSRTITQHFPNNNICGRRRASTRLEFPRNRADQVVMGKRITNSLRFMFSSTRSELLFFRSRADGDHRYSLEMARFFREPNNTCAEKC